MVEKEYLNEENYNKTKSTISIFGTLIVVVLWIVGLGLIGVGVSRIIKYSNKDMLKLEEEKLVKLQEELEIKVKPIEDEIKKLERVEFTGHNEEYYARQDRIIELRESIEKETKQIDMIENVLEEGYSYCIRDQYREDDTVSTYCDYRELDEMKVVPFIIPGIFVSVLSFGFTMMLISIVNRRKIMAYNMQDMMPLTEEGVEKMIPTATKAAKEIAKGIKEGLEEDNK